MKKSVVIVLGLVAFLSILTIIFFALSKNLPWQEEESQEITSEVIYTDTGFNPSVLKIILPAEGGATVAFANLSSIPVDIGQDAPPERSVIIVGPLEPGQARNVIFTEPGIYVYRNALNPPQAGMVEVMQMPQEN